MKKTLDHIYAVVETVADLPSQGVVDKLYAVRSDSTNNGDVGLYLFDGTNYVKAGGGGTDPLLAVRVSTLENALTTNALNFIEDFRTVNKIDSVNTTAVVGPGYVRTDKLAIMSEDFSTTTNYDSVASNNTAVNTTTKTAALIPSALSGRLVSKTIPTAGTELVTVNPIVTQREAMAFSQVNKLSTQNPATYHQGPDAALDRSGRLWYVWHENGTGIRAKVYDTDGALVLDKIILPVLTGYLYIDSIWNDYGRVRITVDYFNRIWVTWPARSGQGTATSSGNAAVAIGAVNADGTIFKTPFNAVSANSAALAFTEPLLDPYGRLWISYSTSSAAAPYNCIAINTADGSWYMTAKQISSTVAISAKMFYSPARDRVIHIFVASGNGNVTGIITDMVGAITNASATVHASSTVLSAVGITGVYDAALDRVIVFAGDVSTGGLRIIKFNPGAFTLAGTTAVVVPSIPVAGSVVTTAMANSISVTGDNNGYYLAYTSGKDSASAFNIHACIVKDDGTVLTPDALVTADTGNNHTRPVIIKNSTGAIRVLYNTTKYSSNYMVEEAVYTMTPSTVTAFVSNDDGVTWYESTPGAQYTFGKIGNKLRVKFELIAPVAGMGPEIRGYSIIEGNNSASSDVVRAFQSSQIPSVLNISQAMIASNQDISGGGKIDWFLSNNGGTTWVAALPNVPSTFTNLLGSDLRVKAVLTYPTGGTKAPFLYGYSVVSYNTALNSDLVILQQNLLKTNFKVAALANSSKYGLKNMVVDDYNDTSGVNTALTTAVWDGESKSFGRGVIQSKADAASFVPTRILLSAEYSTGASGSVVFQISRDGGTTWMTVEPDKLTDLSTQPSGSSLVSRVTLTSDATITSLGYSWG